MVQTLSLALFVACMAMVCCAADAMTFLLAWEGMTLASYVLVVIDAHNEENVRAGLLYLIMAHAGTAAILVAFLTLASHAHAFDFAALRTAARGLDGSTTDELRISLRAAGPVPPARDARFHRTAGAPATASLVLTRTSVGRMRRKKGAWSLARRCTLERHTAARRVRS